MERATLVISKNDSEGHKVIESSKREEPTRQRSVERRSQAAEILESIGTIHVAAHGVSKGAQ